MEANPAASRPLFYSEFEPFCQWEHEEARDVLILHLPEFKKEQLRVQVNSRGILKVSGERSVDARKKSKFYKEVEVPKNCNANGIHAKFANGCLYLIMPKTTTAPAEQTKAPEVDGSGVDQKTKPEAVPDGAEKPAPAEKKEDAGSSGKEKMPTPRAAPADANEPIKDVTKPKSSVSRMKSCAKTSLNVAVAVAALAALSAYVFYMFRSTTLLDDEFF